MTLPLVVGGDEGVDSVRGPNERPRDGEWQSAGVAG